MHREIYSFLNGMHWHDAEHMIPQWKERGIRHGFEGLGHELPPFGLHVKQVHGVDFVEVATPGSQGLAGQADAIFTQLNSHRVAVKTADCVPLLVYHPQLAMAIHAGWRGLAQDILGHALLVLDQKQIPRADCLWGIGPCISRDSFEVGEEVITELTHGALKLSMDELAWTAMKGKGDRWHLDLATLTGLRLRRAGISAEHISLVRTDTKTRSDLWHSFRREGSQVGRNWSWLELHTPS